MKVTLNLDGRTASGGSALITHNERLLDPLDDFTKAISHITGMRKKTEANHLDIARLEFFGGLYTDPVIETPGDIDGQVAGMPAWNIIRCLQDGAKRHKLGLDVLRGVYPLVTFVPLTYESKIKDVTEMWTSGKHAIRKGVGVGQKKVMRTRPMFNEWQCSLPIEIDSEIWDVHKLTVAWRDAGKFAGLCELRPVYGRFNATLTVDKPKKGAAA